MTAHFRHPHEEPVTTHDKNGSSIRSGRARRFTPRLCVAWALISDRDAWRGEGIVADFLAGFFACALFGALVFLSLLLGP